MWYTLVMDNKRTCSVAGCDHKFFALGYCNKHYRRFKRYGDTESRAAKNMTDLQYFQSHTEPQSTGCIHWVVDIRGSGYGYCKRGGPVMLAHRWVYSLYYGDIPDGVVIRHKCDNRVCVNIDHLESGTKADNNRDTTVRERHARIKLSNQQILEIRDRISKGEKQRDLAKEYGVSEQHISGIKYRRTRYHI